MFPNLSIEKSIFVAGLICLLPLSVTAQIAPDGTTNTTVTTDGDRTIIENGARAGGNLFHSFQDFSVPNGNEAFFNNAADVTNIFSRVTGGNISSIDGLIRANDANLFLINPAGVIFGNGASLDIGGSFYGSTADSILFEDGEFSATDLDNPPLLTINAPIGLNFRDNPAPIEVNGSNLTVEPGQNLTLLGGELNLSDSARIFAPGANVELGAVSGSGTIELDDNLKLNFPDNIALADVFLDGDVAVNVSSDMGGSITINASNIELLDNSRLVAGIGQNVGSPDAQAGDIVINASDNITLDGNSFILNQVANNGRGNAGNVTVNTSSLTLNNRSSIGGRTSGQGNSGNVTINAEDAIAVNSGSSLRSLVEANGEGNAGDINIDTGIVTVEGTNDNRSLIFSNTSGRGNAGNININAADSITFDNSSLLAQVKEGANGNGGNVTINTPYLEVRNSASEIPSGTGIFTDTSGTGNAGSINITTDDALVIDRRSSISSGTTSEGNAGDINVTTDLLSLNNFALLSANTRMNANGSAGTISIDANDIDISEGAIIAAFTSTDFTGGEININANTLDVISGGNILTGSDGGGNAGDINLNIADRITIDGSNPAVLPPEFAPFQDPILNDLNGITGVLASTTEQSTGNGGNINILSPNAPIVVSNDAQISVSSQGQGSGGTINIEAQDLTLDNKASISASTPSGQGGSISLAIDDNFTLRNESIITARAFNDADGGNIDIDTNFVIAFPSEPDGSDIIASAEAGDGGNIRIAAEEIFGLQERVATPGNGTNDIDASSQFGFDGSVSIQTPDVSSTRDVVKLSSDIVKPDDSVAQVCSVDPIADSSSFVIKGRGGIPPQPTEPFTADSILGEEESAEIQTRNNELKRALDAQYPPIPTDEGDIYPARGVIVREDGTITLTAYPVSNSTQRALVASQNCTTKP